MKYLSPQWLFRYADAMKTTFSEKDAFIWQDEFGAAITVIDRDYLILYMNDKSIEANVRWGGKALLGHDVRACHKERSVRIIEHILETGDPNVYTIEKQGVHELIYQARWRHNDVIAGMVELSIEIPAKMPHYVRE